VKPGFRQDQWCLSLWILFAPTSIGGGRTLPYVSLFRCSHVTVFGAGTLPFSGGGECRTVEAPARNGLPVSSPPRCSDEGLADTCLADVVSTAFGANSTPDEIGADTPFRGDTLYRVFGFGYEPNVISTPAFGRFSSSYSVPPTRDMAEGLIISSDVLDHSIRRRLFSVPTRSRLI
jgi:hypothetical protein